MSAVDSLRVGDDQGQVVLVWRRPVSHFHQREPHSGLLLGFPQVVLSL